MGEEELRGQIVSAGKLSESEIHLVFCIYVVYLCTQSSCGIYLESLVVHEGMRKLSRTNLISKSF